MIRGLWFFVQLAILVLAAVWLAEQQERFRSNGTAGCSKPRPAILILLVLVAAALVILLWRSGAACWARPMRSAGSAIAAAATRSYAALVQFAGRPRVGRRAWRRCAMPARRRRSASRRWRHLAAAEAAEMAGDIARADEEYTGSRERPDTMMIGLRGLTGLAERQGDLDQALAHARRARKLAPKEPVGAPASCSNWRSAPARWTRPSGPWRMPPSWVRFHRPTPNRLLALCC